MFAFGFIVVVADDSMNDADINTKYQQKAIQKEDCN